MLIKLDSGVYVNTEAIETIGNNFVGFTSGTSQWVTDDDRSFILDAMEYQKPYKDMTPEEIEAGIRERSLSRMALRELIREHEHQEGETENG